jgi:hypothetical protein
MGGGVMERVFKEMLWGVVMIEKNRWLLLEQSIKNNPLAAMKQAEALWKSSWKALKKNGAYLVRLNIDTDGRPCDMMFSWSQSDSPETEGIMPYDADLERLNNTIYYPVEGSIETYPIGH